MTSEARCHKCYAALKPGAEFCGRCGTKLDQQPAATGSAGSAGAGRSVEPIAGECPSCHNWNRPNASFCASCGTQLSQAGTPPGAASSGGYQTPTTGTPQSSSPPQYGEPSSSAPPSAGPSSSAPPPSSAGSYRPEAPSPSAPPAGQGPAGQVNEDPWAPQPAAAPEYRRPMSPDAACPRCGALKNPQDPACTNCGLPFGRGAYAGIPPSVASRGKPAGFWIRLVARIIDSVLLFIVLSILDAIGISFEIDLFEFTDPDGEIVAFPFDLVAFIVSMLYAPIALAVWGTTIGKVIFSIYVYDADGKTPLTFGRALGRELATYVSTFTFLIGYIMAAFRTDKRALHDLIAGTYPTVRRKRSR